MVFGIYRFLVVCIFYYRLRGYLGVLRNGVGSFGSRDGFGKVLRVRDFIFFFKEV